MTEAHWGEPQRRMSTPSTAVAAEVSTDDVDRLLARREARAADPDETPTPMSAVDDLLARREARELPAPAQHPQPSSVDALLARRAARTLEETVR